MNIRITEDQLNVINQMISFQCLTLTAEDAVMEMLANDIHDIERILGELKQLKAMQNQFINLNEIGRPKLYIVK